MAELSEKTEESLASAVGKLLGIPYASRQNKLLRATNGQGLQDVIPAQFAREHEVLPLFRSGDLLAIAMVRPEDTKVVAEIKRVSGLEIQLFVAPRAQLLRAVDEFYGAASGPGPGGAAGRPVRPPAEPPGLTDAAAKDLPEGEP